MKRAGIGFIVIVIVLAAAGFGWQTFVQQVFPQQVTDPAQYATVCATLAEEKSGIAPFLPASPAAILELFYQPKFLQGGEIFQARCCLAPADYKALKSRVAAFPPASPNIALP